MTPGSRELAPPHIQISEGWMETGPEDFSGAFQDCEIGEFAVGDLVLAEAKRAQFVERLQEWRGNNAKIVIYFQTEGEIERFREIMAGAIDGIDFVEGTLARGFCFPATNLVVLSAAELFGRFAAHPRRRLHRAERHRAQIDFSELIGSEVTPKIATPVEDNQEEWRYFSGICSCFSQGGRNEAFTSYCAEVVPKVWLLTRQAQSRRFAKPHWQLPSGWQTTWRL